MHEGPHPGDDAPRPSGFVDDPEGRARARGPADADAAEPGLVVAFLSLIDDVASRLVDHPIRPRVKVSAAGLLRGELDVVKIEVPAVLAAGLVLDRMTVRAEHLRITPGLPPRLQAGPVSLRAHVSQDNIDRWTRAAHLPIRISLTPDGVMITTGLRGIRMGEVLADLEVAGRFLRLSPKRMTIVGLPTPLLRFFRGYLPLPPLPKGARLTKVVPGDGELAVTFELEHLDEPLTPDVAARVRSLTRLTIPGRG